MKCFLLRCNKRMNCFYSIFFVFITLSFNANSTDYYFSNTGNDNFNNGLSYSSPFRSISKLNTLILKPGDNVFFQRNQSFEGEIIVKQSGTSDANITISAYGIGANPVIKGSVTVTNWSTTDGKIYTASLPTETVSVSQVFIDNIDQTLARFPNSGYIKIDSSQNKISLNASGASKTLNYWTNASLIVKTERWAYENLKVSGNSGSLISLNEPSLYSFKKGWGFYINNTLSELDVPGEWYYDAVSNKVYVMAPFLKNPNGLKVDVSIYKNGISIFHNDYITIKGLTFSGQNENGIYADWGNYITVKNNIFSKIGINAIRTGYKGVQFMKILNNTLSDIKNNGIDLRFSPYCTIRENTLKRIGMKAGLGVSGDGQYNAIKSGIFSYVGYNSIDSAGYNGIECRTGDTVVNNTISNVCLVKDDGGGIYCYKSKNIQIGMNIIINPVGNTEALEIPKITYAQGIYLDDSSSYINVYKNTVINADEGIFVHNSFNSTITQNVLFNNRKNQLTLSNDKTIKIHDNNITLNTLYCLHPDQKCMSLWTNMDNLKTFAKYERNYYCHPYNSFSIKTQCVPFYPGGVIPKIQIYDLPTFKTAFGQEVNSSVGALKNVSYYFIKSTGLNLLTNSTFLTNINGWYSWGATGYNIKSDTNRLILNGGSLKSQYTGATLNALGCFASGDFPITSGMLYQIKFQSMSTRPSNIEVDLSKSTYPYTGAVKRKANFLSSSSKKDHTYIFEAKESFLTSRINFNTTGYDSTLWVDNVSVSEVVGDTSVSMPFSTSKLFYNTDNVTKAFSLNGITYSDVNGVLYTGTISIPGNFSKVLFRTQSIGQTVLGTDDLLTISEKPQKSVYPVPVSAGESISIYFPNMTEDGNYSIMNLDGIICKTGSIISDQKNTANITTNDLKKGVYFVELRIKENKDTFKVIIN